MSPSIVGFHFLIGDKQILLAFEASIFFSIKDIKDLYGILFLGWDLVGL
jgi:hypothetical protein